MKYKYVAEKFNSRTNSITELFILLLVGILLMRLSSKLQNLSKIPFQIKSGMCTKRKIQKREREVIDRYQCPTEGILLNLLFRLSGDKILC